TTQDISLTAIPSGTIAGQVRQAGTGLPLSATLTIASDYATYQTTSDPNSGLYALSVFSDVYTVTAVAPGHVPSSTAVIVHPGLTTTQDFVLGSQACLLLVDDDGGADYESYYHDALATGGYYYQTWDTAAHGDPPLAVLQQYQAVLWFSADRHDPGFSYYILSDGARSALTAYLDGGGNLWMTGLNLNAGNYYTDLFGDRLATSYRGSLPGTIDYALSGGGPFAGVTGLASSAVYSDATGFTPDYIIPAAGATGVFTYSLGPWGAGVAHDAGTYRTINLGFGLEALSDPATQAEIVARGLAWLGCVPSPVELQLTKQATGTVVAGGLLTYTLSLTNNSLIPATGLVISDALPTGLEPVAAAQRIITWQVPHLEPGAIVTVQVAARVGDLADGANIVNADYGARAVQSSTLWTGGPVTTTVSGVAPPQAAFTVTALVLAGQPALFTNTTQGFRLLTYTWDFGDGGPAVVQPVTQPTITHLYEGAGWYTVTLTATTPAGSSVYRAPVEVAAARYSIYLPLIRK
ncbi:MAG TPA: DUF11 domain-containing protein, partial [Anaerolineae bacterium]|nr:DUF11 domain-containing protein [Anaerolineae bacterium]